MEKGVGSCNGGMERLSDGVKESDNLDVDILEDLESYMQDVNDRLTISKMVSDTVIKGMVTAVTEEAAEEIAQKEQEELVSHCENEITKLKRNHELKIQDLTKQHFSHRRELLRERGPSLTLKKNKEFEMLRKRLSELISVVDEILVEKEEVDTFGSNEESLSSLKDEVESLLSENHQLRDLLEDNKRAIKCLSLQISEASENLSQRTLAEAKLLETVGNLKAAMEDAQIEALTGEDIFANVVREVVDEIKCIAEESQVENSVVHDAEPSTKCELEDLNMESIIMQELCDIVLKDALKDAEEKLNELHIKYIDEREQLARDAAAALAKENERNEIAAQELENLRGEKCQDQKLISESREVSKAAKRELAEALKQNDRHKADIYELEQKLEVAVKELRQVEEDRRMLLDVNQEKQVAVSLLEAEKRELSEQLKSVAVYVSGFLKSFNDFECRVTQEISGKCSRLKSLTSQSHVLQQKLVRRGLLYKQRFEKKCADLEKAEAEVDLLGDKGDNLLNLVEKLYIGLDHYSPILQHYPGITEILKLLKRELSPENLISLMANSSVPQPHQVTHATGHSQADTWHFSSHSPLLQKTKKRKSEFSFSDQTKPGPSPLLQPNHGFFAAGTDLGLRI